MTDARPPERRRADSTDRRTDAIRDLVLVADPCGRSNPALVVAAARAGALGVLDLPGARLDPIASAALLAEIARRTDRTVALRVAAGAVVENPAHLTDRGGLAQQLGLSAQVDTVVLRGGLAPGTATLGDWGGCRVLVEVTDRSEAAAALAAGAHGLIAKGCESGGRIGDVESFVLAQHIAALGVAFWVQGGMTDLTAAAAVAGGASGVVLDSQVALMRESLLSDDARAAIAAMDGSETRVVGGRRFYVRPDLPAAQLPAATPGPDVEARFGPDLRHHLLPLGQDAAAAADLAARHHTIGGLVQALRSSVDDQLTQAAEVQPLAPGAGVCQTNGTRYPIVQGPMTRVSDRAAFAHAVAEGGGLPFLALALLSGPEVRQLLTETAELLGDRPWGVGVLGFVPAEVRAAQLEVIHDLRPPAALVAGGRPSQAQPLEEAGIATYLHVPSPGLLDRFLAEGARRFVFEGRECGGHVGPRASFPLWDAQVRRLLEHDDPSELDVLFAGGIHNARSAAMVAALAAPLVARGARIGVLMGTAYLFTEEAVASEAITPTFQEVAQSCDTTVLLETAPGHATRCVETDYVRAFAARKAELEAAGRPAQEMWAELETLNLGRLRVASKGVTRHGDGLVDLDRDVQRREGMYMIGQVATLRQERTTVAQLHSEVSNGATDHIALRAAARRSRPVTGAGAAAGANPSAAGRSERSAEIAVVGMAAMFPGAADTEQFWANVVGAVDSVTEVPPERWDTDTFYDPKSTTKNAGRSTPSRWGGFLPWIGFDALRFGIPPRSLASIESVQLLSLEVASRALADAGYDQRPFDRSRASVIFGAENGNDLGGAYGFRAAYPHYVGPLPDELEAHLPAPTEDSFPGVLTNVIAGRIANRLDLGGVNYTVDAACAASLAALDVACKELLSGSSDVVLCGAADVHNSINDYLLFASVHALSPSGRCRTFDAKADGIVLGEGVACVVLKRLADAERDGDRIFAVVEGIAGSSDGRHLGLTAPRQEGQVRALDRAYGNAGIDPASVGLVEAHGTGTVVGDRTELATLTEVFAEGEAGQQRSVLGSVKSQIGHTKCAAGLAGLIKTARALHSGVLPATLHVEQPNDYYDPETSPFRFLDRATPWPESTRRAAVSAFGFGGTNFHAVLRAHDGDDRPEHGIATWPAELFVVRAESADAAHRRLDELAATVARILESDPDGERHQLRDLACSVSASGTGPVRWAIVAESLGDLSAKLSAARSDTITDGVYREPGPGVEGKVAFLHPGQGSQRPGMLADLFVTFPRLQSVLRHGGPVLDRMFPPASFDSASRAAQVAALTDTRAAQPALGLAGMAMTQLLGELDVRPDMVAGHSYGELVALATAGALDAATLLDLSEARAAAMLDAAATLGDDPGTMAAVALPADQLRPRLGTDVVLANDNAPGQAVVAGPTAAVDALLDRLAADKVSAKRIPVAAAFHSPLVSGATGPLARRLDSLPVGPPQLPVWSNATAAPYPTDPDEVRETLAAQLGQPVRFVEQIEAMYTAGARVFVEAGPGRVLTQLVGRILRDRPHVAVATDAPGEPGLPRFLRAVAELSVAGVPVDVRPLFRDRADRVDLATLPHAAPGWRMNGHLVCTHDGEPVDRGLQPATRIPEVTMDQPVPASASNPVEARPQDATVLEYLRSLQQIVEAQREVMLTYLGDRAPAFELPEPPALGPAEALASLGGTALRGPAGKNGTPTNGSSNGNGHDADYHVPHPPVALGPVPAAPAAPVAPAPVAPAPVPAAAAASAPSAEPATPRGEELLAAILAVVGEQTGYPLDMLDPDLDLEADLSIDSIKRIEIIGELADRVGLPGVDPEAGVDEEVVEELARLKTLRAIVEWIDQRADASPASSPGSTPAPAPVAPPAPLAPPTPAPARSPARTPSPTPMPAPAPPADVVAEPVPDIVAAAQAQRRGVEELITRRFVLEAETLAPALPVASLAGQTVAVISDAWDGLDELCRRLQQAGGAVEVHPTHRGAPQRSLPAETAARLAAADVVVHLGAADATAPVDARDVFAALRPAIGGRATTLVAAVTSHRDTSSTVVSGVPGLMRAVARELPDHHVRVVEVVPGQSGKVLARVLADEVLDPAGPASITYRNGVRTSRRVIKGTPIGHDVPALPLNRGSVVLITGGARGITAQCAIGLAEATGCRLELVGRSPLPAEEDPRTAAATDLPALRRVLVEQGELSTPAEIEAACSRIVAAREIRSTLVALRKLGSLVTYHSVDVRDPAALTRVLDNIRTRHGRVDAVIHAAGVLDDKLARDKTDESFDKVFATKVDGARTLLDHLDADTRLVVFFGSVSGVFGNRGQVDYAAANDALDELAQRFDGCFGRRVVSVDWGPWAAGADGGGMVSPELEREYSRRGVGLIDPGEGVRAVLAEMATLPGEPAQVVVMRAEPEALEGRPPTAPGTFAAASDTDLLHDADDPQGLTLEDLTERGL